MGNYYRTNQKETGKQINIPEFDIVNISENPIIMSVGPMGSGKTWLVQDVLSSTCIDNKCLVLKLTKNIPGEQRVFWYKAKNNGKFRFWSQKFLDETQKIYDKQRNFAFELWKQNPVNKNKSFPFNSSEEIYTYLENCGSGTIKSVSKWKTTKI